MSVARRLIGLLAVLLTIPALAAEPASVAAQKTYPGVIKLVVDASDVHRRIFQVSETIPVAPGPLTLLYPEWLPGKHRPAGPIEDLAGLVIRANGERLDWTRNQMDVFEFTVDVPEGVSELQVAFQFLAAQDRSQGRVVMTPQMLNLQWNTVVLYPKGYAARDISVAPSLTLPSSWQAGTALEVASQAGNTIHYQQIDLANLVDSPVFAGAHFKRLDLDPGAERPVYLDIVADAPRFLEINDKQLAIHRALVEQATTLFDSRHFDHYDFLLSLSEQMSGIGLEHHRSSENGVDADYFTNWDTQWLGRDLLAHEFVHSWNGKYRRGADLITPHFNVPMGDSLLWVYEGQTQYWGNVLAVRAGLIDKDKALEELAWVAATYDRNRPGRAWRALQDTTSDPVIAERAPKPWDNYQLSEDYYSGGQLVWLAVDAKLRALSRNRHSLDDFAAAFFGVNDGAWDENPYTFEDVVATLDGIEEHDWTSFLRSRIDGHDKLTDGLAASGWRLVYNDTPSEVGKARSKRGANFIWSIGLAAGKSGELREVRWGSPAFDAGITPAMKLVAVNGIEYDAEALERAIDSAAESDQPIAFLVKEFNRYRSIEVDYHGGLQYPHLERIDGQPDYLSDILEAR